FEPIHGSAFDIIGKGIANPIASFWTAVEMLNFLGEEVAADALMTAIEQTTWAGIMTPDVGGTAGTAEVTSAVINALLDSKAWRKSVG
ncbi:MAG: isocitrate/isopropylmalate family dehydrogenase, partial [Rhodospirillaceae bacterium]|nr:isocitrate/isopropylmalate family dehydrogenase [Rhodospirillaceae bacterium]